MIRFGVHCSIRDGLKNAIYQASESGCEAVQIFTRSPRMWKHGFSSPKEIEELKKSQKIKNIHPLVVHAPYLPNLATAKKTLYKLSLNSLKDDLAFCDKICADYLVIHPGAYSDGSSLETGLRNISKAVNSVFAEVSGKTMILVENVAGGGRRIGKTFNEISRIIFKIKDKKRVGVCFDTAHAFGAGYDLSKKSGIERALREFDSEIGLDKLKVIHFNDSAAPLRSNKDRHAHLGKGHIGIEGFRYFIKRVKYTADAGILETPKDTPMSDKKNLKILFKLRGKE